MLIKKPKKTKISNLMDKKIICGIQQIGVGIPDVYNAWEWYRKIFGLDIPVFDDAGTAALMLPYTDNRPHERHAVLAINIQGGGGFEIWQYKSRQPQPAKFDLQIGDLGIFIGKIKSRNVSKAFLFMKSQGVKLLTDVVPDLKGNDHFYVKDNYNNIFEVVENDSWFANSKALTGGPCGAVIGVSNMEKSIDFYEKILGYDKVVYDMEGFFDDFENINGGKNSFRRVLLRHSKSRLGAFSELLGNTEIELVKVNDRTPRKIFENRLWGDLGFIHLCFDVRGIDAIKAECASFGSPFTVDTGASFDMGEAAGRFAYAEDPDGTLIEFVETNKLPILKAVGFYLNLQKRDPEKPLPNWILKLMRLTRVKD